MSVAEKSIQEYEAKIARLSSRVSSFETEAQETRKERLESEERFRALFERSTIGQSLTGPDGRLISVNRTFADMLGLSVDDMQLAKFEEITHGDDVAESLRCLQGLLDDEFPSFRMEKRYKHSNGSCVVADVSTTLIRDKSGLPAYFITSIVDVTSSKQAQRALEASESRYRRLFEAAKDGILILDADTGKIVDVNPFLLELTGYSHSDFLGKCLWEIGLFKDIASSKTAFATLQAQSYVRYEHLPLEARDGRKINVEFVSNVYQVDEQNVIQCNIRDITDRKRVERALREKERLLSESQRLGHIGSWLWDTNGSVAWSDELYHLYGVSPDTFTPTAESLIGLVHPNDRSAMQAWISDCAAAKQPVDLEYRINMTDDTIHYFRGRGQAVYDVKNQLTHVAGTVQDITSQREHENLLEQLRVSQKMEAVGRLAGGVAHDFNNLLSVILIYNELATELATEGASLKNELLEVKNAANRAVALTKQLLAFSRKQVLQPVSLDLNIVASGVEKMLQRVLGEDIDLALILAPDIGLTLADAGQIEQVILNLAINARDAMPRGGKLTIETANVEITDAYVAAHVSINPGSYVQLIVTDTGDGMDEQTRVRIFEPFFTTKEMGKGTGLGLSTVYGIIKQSGGNIWVYSELRRGTTFKVYLPREHSATTHMSTSSPNAPRPSAITETVLVVEDDVALRRATSRILSATGYNVLTAADGDMALLTCAQHAGDIHLILTDVVMPRMSGKVLAQELSSVRPTSKILYMSGYTDNAIGLHGVLAAGAHFLSKPFTTSDLTRKVREALDAGES